MSVTQLPLNNNSTYYSNYLGYVKAYSDLAKTNLIYEYSSDLGNIRGVYDNGKITMTPIINPGAYSTTWIESNLYQERNNSNIIGNFEFKGVIESNSLLSPISPNYELYVFIKAFTSNYTLIQINTSIINPIGNFSVLMNTTDYSEIQHLQWGFFVNGYPAVNLDESIARGSVIIGSISQITPTIGSLNTQSPKTYGDSPFSLTNPTSNSPGSFSYTSSNLLVATVSGNTVTIVGAGSTIIRATQSATTNFTSGFTESPLQVNQSTPTNPTKIQNGNELEYFMNTNADYAIIENNTDITNKLISNSSSKTLVAKTNNINITLSLLN